MSEWIVGGIIWVIVLTIIFMVPGEYDEKVPLDEWEDFPPSKSGQ